MTSCLVSSYISQVIVLDNDAGLLRNMDHIRHAPTPSAVFHTTIGPLAKRTRCAVSTSTAHTPHGWGPAPIPWDPTSTQWDPTTTPSLPTPTSSRVLRGTL
jgi:hypothetical protein